MIPAARHSKLPLQRSSARPLHSPLSPKRSHYPKSCWDGESRQRTTERPELLEFSASCGFKLSAQILMDYDANTGLTEFFWTACCSHQATWRPNKVLCSFLWSNQREIKDENMWNVDKGLLFFPKVTWKNWQGLTLLFQKVLQSMASFAKNSYFSHYQSLISQILSWLNGHTVGCKKALKQQTHCRITFPITTGVCLYCLLFISVCRVCIGSCFILQCNKEQKKDTLGDSN